MAICYLLGMLLRMIRGLREELIPLILGLCGAALGVAYFLLEKKRGVI